MDFESIIMTLGALLLIVAPILYYQKKQRDEQGKVRAHLDKLGNDLHLTFSLHEFWGSGYALGLDTTKNVLFYLSSTDGEEQYTQVNLADVAQCSVVNEFRDVNGNRVIDKISLHFTLKKPGAHQSLLFYDKEQNLNFTKELLLAEKWKDIVSANILLKKQQVAGSL